MALHKHLHSRVLWQLGIIGVVSLGLLGFVAYDAATGQAGLGVVAVGLVIGLVVGVLASRIFSMQWHQETQKVIVKMDKLSIVLIALYIAFRIFGNDIFGQFLQGEALSAFSFTLLAGILLGRLFGMWSAIRRILRAQGII